MKLKLIEKRKEIGNIVSFVFDAGKQFKWIAGQYLIYKLPHQKEDLRGRMRFFTISSAPFQKHPTITTRIFEDNPSSFKKELNSLGINDEIEAKGPDGDFVWEGENNDYIFIAGGIGITPFNSIIRQLSFEKKKINITLIYSNKVKNDVLFKNELDAITKDHPEFKIDYLFSPQRVDEEIIKKYLDYKKIYYVSGPDPMVDAVIEIIKKMGVKEEKIRTDYFSGYKA